jgi:LAO/AO transport system kinase
MRGMPALDDVAGLAAAIRAGERAVLARAITLVESRKAAHRRTARALLQALLPHTGGAIRLGLTGVPGVGKSTMLDALGTLLTGRGHRVAVLAVDPSSTRTGGSILGDKTRMGRLAVDPSAFIRPSPSAGSLGGVAARTRETMLICEAAGFDVVVVETVGIGQSEVAVAGMVDTFAVLVLPGAGDELQGIKKGVIEIADILAVNKADGDNRSRALAAAAELKTALHILSARDPVWSAPVLTVSGRTGEGLDGLWAQVVSHRERMTAAGRFDETRATQQVAWMWSMIEERLLAAVRGRPEIAGRLAAVEAEVRAGRLAATVAADEIVGRLGLGEI